jgi:hypothetical protein
MCKVCDGTADNRGHVWQLGEDGKPDYFAFEEGDHNGYCCIRCGYIFCHHCEDGPQEDCTFIDQEEMPL